MMQSILRLEYPKDHAKAGQLMAILNLERICYMEGDDESGGTRLHWQGGNIVIPHSLEQTWELVGGIIKENYDYYRAEKIEALKAQSAMLEKGLSGIYNS